MACAMYEEDDGGDECGEDAADACDADEDDADADADSDDDGDDDDDDDSMDEAGVDLGLVECKAWVKPVAR